ncbi:MAG: hypothetical protein J5605_08965 [Bacteroidales bacterium]|nr:hypothetical protein [Bacteroidales bacterium]
MTPKLVTGVWIGGEMRSIHFNNMTYGQGAAAALPIWGIYMKKIYDNPNINLYKGNFDRPAHLNVEMDCSKYQQEIQQEEYEYNF